MSYLEMFAMKTQWYDS